MSVQAIAWAMQQKVGSPTGKILLICLANYANAQNVCWHSQDTISKETELGERATRDWLKKLERQGYIRRQRRNRADGSRTSDLIRICLERQPDSDQEVLPADFAGRSIQAASDAAPTGISRRTYRHHVPGNEPEIEPTKEPTLDMREGKGGLFSKFWETWPVEARPNKRQYVQNLFERLIPQEQADALSNARGFRQNSEACGKPALMIPYLRDRLFLQFENSPAVEADGNFRIEPKHAEWAVWMASIETTHGIVAMRNQKTLGFILRKQRWPSNTTALPVPAKAKAHFNAN